MFSRCPCSGRLPGTLSQRRVRESRKLSPKEIHRAGIFDPERVQQLLRYDIEEGAGRYGIRLWMLLTFEIWRRLVIEGEDV